MFYGNVIFFFFCWLLYSLVTTDSTASDDDIPPPLPAKNRESEYSNTMDRDSLGLSDYCSPTIMNNIMVSYFFICFYI